MSGISSKRNVVLALTTSATDHPTELAKKSQEVIDSPLPAKESQSITRQSSFSRTRCTSPTAWSDDADWDNTPDPSASLLVEASAIRVGSPFLDVHDEYTANPRGSFPHKDDKFPDSWKEDDWAALSRSASTRKRLSLPARRFSDVCRAAPDEERKTLFAADGVERSAPINIENGKQKAAWRM